MKQIQTTFIYYSLTVFQLSWAKMAGVDHDPRLPCRADGLAPVAECLPSNPAVLSSSPSTAKKTNKQTKNPKPKKTQVAFSKRLQCPFMFPLTFI
jgi:hypothetical protein